MPDLFTEALNDAKKLREVAEIDAKNKLIKKMAPFIAETINQQIKEQVFLGEQEIEEEEEVVAPGAVTDAAAKADAGVDLSGETTTAPVTPASGGDIMNVSVPDEDGKITVDFEDLFASEPEEAAADPMADAAPTASDDLVQEPADKEPAVAPTTGTTPTDAGSSIDDAAAEPGNLSSIEEPQDDQLAPQAVTPESFVHHVNECSWKVDQVYHQGGSASRIVKEALKTRLFSLIESLDTFKESGLITSRQAKINENKLEFLFMKLQESETTNSYNRSETDHAMKKKTPTLKEISANLYREDASIAQDSASTGKTGVPTDPSATAQARKQSGVSPEIGHPADLEGSQDQTHLSEEINDGFSGTVEADNINDVDHGETPWEDGEARISENHNADAHNDVALGAAGFGDTNEEPPVEFEVPDSEIREAVRRIRKETIRRKMSRGLSEASAGGNAESWEDAEPEDGADPSHKHLKEQEMPEDFGDEVDVFSDDAMEPSADGDVVITLDLPDELADVLATVSDADVSATVDFNSMADDEEIILVDDAEGDDTDPDVDFEVEDLVEESVRRRRPARKPAPAARKPAPARKPISEEVKAKKAAVHFRDRAKKAEGQVEAARSVLKARDTRIKELTEALAAQNLFTAKAVFLNKFLMREGLSKKALCQIIEHLDNAKTLAEAKTVYTSIKTRLDEHVQKTSQKMTGSPSKVTKSGSAPLTESRKPQTNRPQTDASPTFTVERFQQLAGIKKKS